MLDQANLSENTMSSKMKVVEAVEGVMKYIRDEATSREDGNTTALVDRITRDLTQLQLEYRSLTFTDMQGLSGAFDEDEDKPGDGYKDGGFVAHSYEKTGAKDVNPKPYPPTGEDSGAPFVSKSDTSVDEDGNLINDPDKKSGVTKSTGFADADNPEEEFTRSPKSGKGAKANT